MSKAINTLEFGCSIQGGKVFTNAGEVWGEFASHEIAKAAVDAYRVGIDNGIKIGEQRRTAEFRKLLGLSDHQS